MNLLLLLFSFSLSTLTYTLNIQNKQPKRIKIKNGINFNDLSSDKYKFEIKSKPQEQKPDVRQMKPLTTGQSLSLQYSITGNNLLGDTLDNNPTDNFLHTNLTTGSSAFFFLFSLVLKDKHKSQRRREIISVSENQLLKIKRSTRSASFTSRINKTLIKQHTDLDVFDLGREMTDKQPNKEEVVNSDKFDNSNDLTNFDNNVFTTTAILPSLAPTMYDTESRIQNNISLNMSWDLIDDLLKYTENLSSSYNRSYTDFYCQQDLEVSSLQFIIIHVLSHTCSL